MVVVSYSDFFENPSKFKECASRFGIKILPQKKQKKISYRVQKKLNSLNAIAGMIPTEINAEELLQKRKFEN